MPLARIITRSPQDTVAAAEYLRSQGYTVETVSPEEFRVTPAELELDLNRCGPDEALSRVKALLEAPPSDAASAQPFAPPPDPTSPRKAKVPVAYGITGQPVEFAEEEDDPVPERRQRPNSIGRALGSMLSRSKAQMAAAVAGAWKSVTGPARDFQRNMQERRALKLEAEVAMEREEVRREEEVARERLRQESERQRQEQFAADQQAEREMARAAELREAMIAARPQPAKHVNPPEPVAEGVAEPLTNDLVAQPAELREETLVGSRDPQGLAPRPTPAQPVLVRRRRHAPILISRTAIATAVGASLLLLLGFVAYANRRPASQLLPGGIGAVRQDLPFGAATITPPAPPPQTRASAHAKTSPAVRSGYRKPGPAPRRSSRGDSDDVVVRHLPQSQPQPTTANLKRHSDVD